MTASAAVHLTIADSIGLIIQVDCYVALIVCMLTSCEHIEACLGNWAFSKAHGAFPQVIRREWCKPDCLLTGGWVAITALLHNLLERHLLEPLMSGMHIKAKVCERCLSAALLAVAARMN
jgi:hypothetical protein